MTRWARRFSRLIKAKEHEGYSFEAAEASIALLVRRLSPDYRPVFQLHDYRGMVSRHGERQSAEATIKLNVNGREVHMVAEGNGPVNAFDTALRKALPSLLPANRPRSSWPTTRCASSNGNSGTGAITRVLIDWHDGTERRWSTVGAGTNILDATWLALADGYEFALSQSGVERADPSALLPSPTLRSARSHTIFIMNAKIVLLPGDGIGPEVVNEARRVLDAVAQIFGHTFEYSEHLLGGCAIDATGTAMPEATLEGVHRRRMPCCSAPWAVRSGMTLRPRCARSRVFSLSARVSVSTRTCAR